jgi:hypothetical protein
MGGKTQPNGKRKPDTPGDSTPSPKLRPLFCPNGQVRSVLPTQGRSQLAEVFRARTGREGVPGIRQPGVERGLRNRVIPMNSAELERGEEEVCFVQHATFLFYGYVTGAARGFPLAPGSMRNKKTARKTKQTRSR